MPPAPAAKNGAPVTATATRRVVAETHGFYPQLHDAVDQTADVINHLASVFLRTAKDVNGDIWILTQSQPQRLTQDGGYVSLRPSADGSKVAFARAGTIGILDVATKQLRPIPADAAITRLLGWDEPNGALLGVRGDGHVVSIMIAEGHVKILQDQPETPDELAAHEVLAHLTRPPGVLYIEDVAGSWAVTEKSGACRIARPISCRAVFWPIRCGHQLGYSTSVDNAERQEPARIETSDGDHAKIRRAAGRS